MSTIDFVALDGSNPIGFMAALGVLAIVTEQRGEHCRLRWRYEGTWTAQLSGVERLEDVIAACEADLATWQEDAALDLHYPGKAKDIYEIKPPPDVYRSFLDALIARGERRPLDFAAAYASDVVTDNNGAIKPTALHFAAGQQVFLDSVRQLRSVTADDLHEALIGPWQYASKLPTLRWDAGDAREYALRASDPSADKKLGVPGADWLAFRGLAGLPTYPVMDERRGQSVLKTTCVFGGWKDGVFRWPLWSVPLSRDGVRSVLSTEIPKPAKRAARGIAMVFESSIRRSAQGGYGNFTPGRVI